MVSMTVTSTISRCMQTALFTKEAAKYQAAIKVIKNGQEYNAKVYYRSLVWVWSRTELTIT